MQNIENKSVRDIFLEPLNRVFSELKNSRECPEFSDYEYVLSGIFKVLSNTTSGRDWIQSASQYDLKESSLYCLFNSLKSERRLNMLKEVSLKITHIVDESVSEEDFVF